MRLVIPDKPRQTWNSPIKDYDILTDETCKLLIEQSRAHFEETIEESEELTERSAKILFLLLPAVAAVVGYCITSQEKFKPFGNFSFMLLLGAIGSFIYCIINLFKLMALRTFTIAVLSPKK
jgi:hypothetical protein